jgi:hypothetical protein
MISSGRAMEDEASVKRHCPPSPELSLDRMSLDSRALADHLASARYRLLQNKVRTGGGVCVRREGAGAKDCLHGHTLDTHVPRLVYHVDRRCNAGLVRKASAPV